MGVSSDAFNAVKGKKCQISDKDRMEIVKAIRYVDEVIPETSWDQKVRDIQDHDVDVFVMGDDWKGKFDELKEYCEVVYLPRTEGISTTQLKDELGSKKAERKDENPADGDGRSWGLNEHIHQDLESHQTERPQFSKNRAYRARFHFTSYYEKNPLMKS